MTGHRVMLKVSANVPKDCSFWPEDDSWNGVCEELSLTVRGSSFEWRRMTYCAGCPTLVVPFLERQGGWDHHGRLISSPTTKTPPCLSKTTERRGRGTWRNSER